MGKRKASEWEAEMSGPLLTWLELPFTAASLAAGSPTKGPVVQYVKSEKIFQYGHGFLQDLVSSAKEAQGGTFEDLKEEVEYTHIDDSNLAEYKDIADALTALIGEDNSLPFCLATCKVNNVWAIGTAMNWKGREQAAKLSLAVGIAAEDGKIEAMALEDPEFGSFAVRCELMDKSALPEGAKGTGALQYPVYELNVDGASALVQSGMPASSIGVVFDKDYAEVYGEGSWLLGELGITSKSDVTYEHVTDSENSELYPEIKLAFAQRGGEDNYYVVASVPGRGWGVGFASGWDKREKAARIALSMALARQENLMDKLIGQYSAFKEFCLAVHASTPDKAAACVNQQWETQNKKSNFEWGGGGCKGKGKGGCKGGAGKTWDALKGGGKGKGGGGKDFGGGKGGKVESMMGGKGGKMAKLVGALMEMAGGSW